MTDTLHSFAFLAEANSEISAPEGFLGQLATLLGEAGLTRDPDAMAPWLTDWRGRYTGRALALASPPTPLSSARWSSWRPPPA
jgi:hypothetical protein